MVKFVIMRHISFLDFMNQRKTFSHLSFLLFSLLFTIIFGFTENAEKSFAFLSGTFLLIFFQLEVFIFFGNLLFSGLNFDRSPVEITRIVVVRFTIFLAACLLAAMILYLLLQYSILLIQGKDLSDVLNDFIHTGFRVWFRSTIMGLSAGALIFIILLWQFSLRREQKLREENLIFQNETLKNQINPHFLFNSLNTLSSLIPDHPEDAEKFINKLSSIYRYILENSQKDRVPLKTELDFILDYFELHKVRDKEKIVLKIDTSGVTGFDIIPVSLQILIENAVKHNMTTRGNPLLISITIERQYIIVKNNLQKMGSRLESTKIGLKNLAERVRLVTKKDLIVEETNDFFIVKVPLLK
jgi:two-component system LytT family sensor kinase